MRSSETWARLAAAILATGAVALVAPPASAQAPTPVAAPPADPQRPSSAADKAEAQRLYVEAKALRDRGDRAAALDRFRRSHDLAPTPVTRLELARMLVVVGRLVEAHRLADAVASLPVTPTETAKGRKAREDAAALSLDLAPRIPRVTLAVTPPGADAEVRVDGAPVSKELLAGEQDVDPGEHVVVARVDERTVERRFTVAEGERLTVELPIPPPPAPPPSPAPPPVAAPAPAAVAPEASPAPAVVEDDPLSPAVPFAFTVAGVALATGITTGAIALVQAGDLKDGRCPGGRCPPDEQDLLSAHEAVATTSNVAFAIAGAAAAVGIVVLVVDLSDDPAPSASPAASVRLRWAGTGLAAEGTWN